MTTSVKSDKKNVKKTLLGYELSSLQDAVINCLVPSICSWLLYVFTLAADIAVIHRHNKDEDPIWASITLFLMYLPLLGSYIVIVTDLELWPEPEGYGLENLKWVLIKTLEHLWFPIWRMWRYAERIFWSIEAIRSQDEESRAEAISYVHSARNIELYVFLQAYLHALPQVLFQLYILMRHESDINRQTEDAQIVSIVLNLAKVSITTTYYQRFKSQKLAGRQYPWFKSAKKSSADEETVALRRPGVMLIGRTIIESKRESSQLEDRFNLEPPQLSERRRSSDLYLEPTTSTSNSYAESRQSARPLLETGYDTVDARIDSLFRKSSGSDKRSHRNTGSTDKTEPDFNIRRLKVIEQKGLPEDDLAGILIAFFWWFGFLLARVLAISTFAYFFVKETMYILCSHFLLVIAFLIYDVKSDQVSRAKSVFFLFIGLIYIFCIIEFKIKFKKAMFIYYGFFVLVFIENFVMCLIWYLDKLETIENDFWFRYIFYIIVMCSLTSFSSMLFYFNVNKPEKVVVKMESIIL